MPVKSRASRHLGGMALGMVDLDDWPWAWGRGWGGIGLGLAGMGLGLGGIGLGLGGIGRPDSESLPGADCVGGKGLALGWLGLALGWLGGGRGRGRGRDTAGKGGWHAVVAFGPGVIDRAGGWDIGVGIVVLGGRGRGRAWTSTWTEWGWDGRGIGRVWGRLGGRGVNGRGREGGLGG